MGRSNNRATISMDRLVIGPWALSREGRTDKTTKFIYPEWSGWNIMRPDYIGPELPEYEALPYTRKPYCLMKINPIDDFQQFNRDWRVRSLFNG